MRAIVRKSQFKRDFKKLRSSGRKLDRLWEAVELLQSGAPMPPHMRDHALTGDWIGYRDCHLGGDWLLIYQRTDALLILVRTGTHSELFG